MEISRRQLLVAGSALIAAPFVARYAHAAEFTLKYGGDRPASHPAEIEAVAVAKRIKEQTNGRVEILIFSNNQLGSSSELLSQLRAGAIHFFQVSGILISSLVPVTAIHGLGFAFQSYNDVWKAMDGELGQVVKDKITKAGIHVQNKMWDSGFRQITTSTKPINSPDDLNGFKMRVPVAPMWVSLFKALGASPTSISSAELYSSLQTRLVDGQENPFPTIDSFKMYEVQKFCSLTNHMWDGNWILSGRRIWDNLPEDLRDIVSKNWDLGAENERKANLDSTNQLRSVLESKGMVFNEPKLEPFRAKLAEAGFYAEWREKFGDQAWAVLEKYTGKLS